MSLLFNSNLALNTFAQTNATLGNSLNGLNSSVGLGINGSNGLNSRTLASLGFGLSGIGNIGGFNNLANFNNPNNFSDFNPLNRFGLCQRCIIPCPTGTSCNNGICRANYPCGYISNPNYERVYGRDSRYSHHSRHSRNHKHH